MQMRSWVSLPKEGQQTLGIDVYRKEDGNLVSSSHQGVCLSASNGRKMPEVLEMGADPNIHGKERYKSLEFTRLDRRTTSDERKSGTRGRNEPWC
jgi:hypothetical protein